jgi:hypothetical protein
MDTDGVLCDVETKFFLSIICINVPIPVAAQSKAWICGRLLAGIAGPQPAGGMDVLSLVNVMCCQAEVSATGRSLV